MIYYTPHRIIITKYILLSYIIHLKKYINSSILIIQTPHENKNNNSNSPTPPSEGTISRKLQRKWLLIGQYLASQCLFHNNQEIILEAVKAYGKVFYHGIFLFLVLVLRLISDSKYESFFCIKNTPVYCIF